MRAVTFKIVLKVCFHWTTEKKKKMLILFRLIYDIFEPSYNDKFLKFTNRNQITLWRDNLIILFKKVSGVANLLYISRTNH